MLKPSHRNALLWLLGHGGSVLVTMVEDKSNSNTVFGDTVPGINAFKQLDKLEYVIITEEDPVEFDEGEFTFTPSIEITTLGRSMLVGY